MKRIIFEILALFLASVFITSACVRAQQSIVTPYTTLASPTITVVQTITPTILPTYTPVPLALKMESAFWGYNIQVFGNELSYSKIKDPIHNYHDYATDICYGNDLRSMKCIDLELFLDPTGDYMWSPDRKKIAVASVDENWGAVVRLCIYYLYEPEKNIFPCNVRVQHIRYNVQFIGWDGDAVLYTEDAYQDGGEFTVYRWHPDDLDATIDTHDMYKIQQANNGTSIWLTKNIKDRYLIIDRNENILEKLKTPYYPDDYPLTEVSPTLSPNGKYVAYQDNNSLVILNLATSSKYVPIDLNCWVTFTSNCGSWSEDSKYFAVIDPDNIYIIDVDTNTVIHKSIDLNPSASFDSIQWWKDDLIITDLYNRTADIYEFSP